MGYQVLCKVASQVAYFIIGVYFPFFLLGRAYLSVILSVYALLIVIWRFPAKCLGTHPAFLRKLDRSGHWIMPAVLIALGIYVLRS
jgi:cadmium resistance protein CadD (predicted permease)